MSLPIHVDAYSGYKANERPQYLAVDEDLYEIAAVLDHWYEPSATYFKVKSTEGKTYLLRYEEQADDWTLQSGFDAADAVGYGESMGMRVDVVSGWRTSRPEDRWRRRMRGDIVTAAGSFEWVHGRDLLFSLHPDSPCGENGM